MTTILSFCLGAEKFGEYCNSDECLGCGRLRAFREQTLPAGRHWVIESSFAQEIARLTIGAPTDDDVTERRILIPNLLKKKSYSQKAIDTLLKLSDDPVGQLAALMREETGENLEYVTTTTKGSFGEVGYLSTLWLFQREFCAVGTSLTENESKKLTASEVLGFLLATNTRGESYEYLPNLVENILGPKKERFDPHGGLRFKVDPYAECPIVRRGGLVCNTRNCVPCKYLRVYRQKDPYTGPGGLKPDPPPGVRMIPVVKRKAHITTPPPGMTKLYAGEVHLEPPTAEAKAEAKAERSRQKWNKRHEKAAAKAKAEASPREGME